MRTGVDKARSFRLTTLGFIILVTTLSPKILVARGFSPLLSGQERKVLEAQNSKEGGRCITL